jgi:hypothetical protein
LPVARRTSFTGFFQREQRNTDDREVASYES